MKEKLKYITPALNSIELDNDISLQLESNPPDGPYESLSVTHLFSDNDPYKLNNCI